MTYQAYQMDPKLRSPVQILRKRNPRSIVNHYEAEKVSLTRKDSRTIHMSLEDLSDNPSPDKDELHKSTPSIVKEPDCIRIAQDTITNSLDKSNIQAARRIYEALMLNAWRKRKEDSQELLQLVHKLKSEVERYKMKLYSLKSILIKETERSGYAIKKISILESKMQDYEKLIDAMKQEIDRKVRVILEMEDLISSERTLRSNTKNDLIQSKMEESALREQLTKEREKLKKLRGDLEEALNKVKDLEVSVVTKNKRLQRVEESLHKERDAHSQTQRQVEEEKDRYKVLLDENKRLTGIIDNLEEVKATFEEEILRSSQEAQEREKHISALEKELQSHQFQLSNSKMLLADILQERRQLEEINDEKESDLIILAKSVFSGVGRIPLAIYHSITYALWPLESSGGVQRSGSFH
ncbi:E3 ubiquitin-protein ligase BRE1A isoform X2 [Ischnura elegans]|uniref:E3 ubiquitin-protein ligase BRE1A isoform X2 n=1 Tax=Ischnura elegans TaxID=197161 RepID=UPI001ED88113|nr:E3 ubiquitin-protein ligase BRE1A isoform X2 [Ischnura elegans]